MVSYLSRVSGYFLFGLLGVLAGALFVIYLGALTGAPPAAVLIVVVAPQLCALFTVTVAHMIAGHERMVFYEQLLACLAGTALVLWVAGEAVWAGLDLLMLGLGVSALFGRIGCLRAGCCHGRPWRWGIAYGQAHARAGFPRHYVDISLFPVQALESLLHMVLTFGAMRVLLSPHRPGEVVLFYLAGYGLHRFVLELARGDRERPYWQGLSQAQWMALVTVWCCVLLAARWRGPALAAAMLMTCGAAVLVWRARYRPYDAWSWRQPARVAELAAALGRLRVSRPGVVTANTPAGLRISFSSDRDVYHYGLSLPGRGLSATAAQVVAEQICLLQGYEASHELRPGQQQGVFHVRVGKSRAARGDQLGRY